MLTRGWLFAALSITVLTTLVASANAQGALAKPELISFRSGELELKGFIWKPAGAGPFPAILWNHGSEKLPGTVDPVAPFFVARGYLFFVPPRAIAGPLHHGSIESSRSGTELDARQAARGTASGPIGSPGLSQEPAFCGPAAGGRHGLFFGGIQTMLAVERSSAYRAAVNCSGAAQTWGSSPDLQARLIRAARNAVMPVFFLQAQNDYDLTPNRVLGEHMKASGKPVESKVYPPYGFGAQGGHSFCVNGASIWGPDVVRFIHAHLK